MNQKVFLPEVLFEPECIFVIRSKKLKGQRNVKKLSRGACYELANKCLGLRTEHSEIVLNDPCYMKTFCYEMDKSDGLKKSLCYC